jgi:uncharacterized protein (DUF362 family)
MSDTKASPIYEEFIRELAQLRQRCAGHPCRELIQLFLMALEREEIVSIAYRESLMQRRLDSMPLSPEVREVIRHALVWIWKDEEMHTIYIRGAILKIGSWPLRTKAFLTQLAGGIGGWASSVMQHCRWRQAPLSRTCATAITWIGRLIGKVPEDVSKYLQYGSFRDFCDYNIDAEKTAALCWLRIAELATSQPDLNETLQRDFARVSEDEVRHERLFTVLSDALTDDDELSSEESVTTLLDKIRAVGEEFLPRSQRQQSDLENPLGSGQPVHVLQGDAQTDKRALFRKLLDESKLADAIAQRAAFLDRPVSEINVAIKPTFMLGYHRNDPSPVTDPELLEELVDYIADLGVASQTVIEGRNIYDKFFHNRSINDVANYFEIGSPKFRVVDSGEEQVDHNYRRGMAQYSIARSWRDADFRISFPKLRSHPIEMALLAVGNVEWVGGRCDEYLFLDRQADRSTAIMMLLDEFPPHFGILDGFENVPDGLVGVMGCRKPRQLNRFYAGADSLAVDTVALRHLGVVQHSESSILRAAEHWFGGSSGQIQVIGDDTTIRQWRGPHSNDFRTLLSVMAYPVYVMGSGRGALFVPRMDRQAFPSIKREGICLRMTRAAIRRLLGL